MVSFSVCVDAVYRRMDFTESLKEIKQCGFGAFEFWTWWDKDMQAIQAAKQELGLELTAFCTKMISLVDAEQRPAYLEGLQQSIQVAQMLGCRKLITQVGDELPGVSRLDQLDSLVQGLKACVPYLEESGITLIEIRHTCL